MDIKFRAWSKKDKMMLPWSTIRQSAFNNSKDGFGLLYQILVTRREDFDLMLPVGLKDKERKEIYAGDVVSYIDIPTGLHDGNYEVIFDAGFIGINTLLQSNLCDIGCHKYVEVIGNKYDNPELLEK